MIFANSRRLAERLAAALNDTAGEEIALAHHGSISKDTRLAIEDRLKRGELPAIVATSSLELGIDVGAVDLVVQIEAPPSVASGLQRIGRAGHSVGAVSRGIVFPKYRGDLLAAAASTARMVEGKVEETFYPKNPLDVLAQQIVAEVGMGPTTADALYTLVRRAAPFADLPRASFEGVLDMLSGRYPSDEFAELRPRLTWDRESGRLSAREGAKRIAVINGGTIPDRGLYGVYLQDAEAKSRRVGELDEEMVFESRVGDVFLLGASSWRITEITHDRVLVAPAPGEPGKMPFWRGDRPGRPPELGRAIGALARTLLAAPHDTAMQRLREQHGLDAPSAENLLAYLREQAAATGEVPSDQTLVVERYRDEIGDYRVCILSPFGSRVHAPWCTAVLSRLREASDQDIEGIWSDDGIVFRLPGTDDPPDVSAFFPDPDTIRGPRRPEPRWLRRLRRALSRERRPRAPPPTPPPRPALPALGDPQEGRRPARRRVALRVVPAPPRDVPRVPPRRLRPSRPHGPAPPDHVAHRARRHGRLAHPVAVRRFADVLLRRQLPLRRRRPARRAPRPRPERGPDAAQGAAR